MGKTTFSWWSAYGSFDSGEDGLPHFGQVFKHYRELRGWSKEELATVLNYTERYIEMLESAKNTKMPESLPRRVFIARALGIPFILLGVSPIVQVGQVDDINLLTEITETFKIANPRIMTMYERMLAFCWEACYTSSFQRAAGYVAFLRGVHFFSARARSEAWYFPFSLDKREHKASPGARGYAVALFSQRSLLAVADDSRGFSTRKSCY